MRKLLDEIFTHSIDLDGVHADCCRKPTGDAAESAPVAEHLPGQHDQDDHGNRDSERRSAGAARLSRDESQWINPANGLLKPDAPESVRDKWSLGFIEKQIEQVEKQIAGTGRMVRDEEAKPAIKDNPGRIDRKDEFGEFKGSKRIDALNRQHRADKIYAGKARKRDEQQLLQDLQREAAGIRDRIALRPSDTDQDVDDSQLMRDFLSTTQPDKDLLKYLLGESTPVAEHLPGQHDQSDHGNRDGGPSVDTPELRSWFAGSQITDSSGEPLVLYHGTDATFDRFDPTARAPGRVTKEYGIFLTPREKYAAGFGSKLLKVYANVRNPLVVKEKSDLTPRDYTKEFIDALREQGYDGIITGVTPEEFAAGDRQHIDEVTVFDPEQVQFAQDAERDQSSSTPRGTERIEREVAKWSPERRRADWKARGTQSATFKAFFGDWEHDRDNASKVVKEDGEPQETHEIDGSGSVVTGDDGQPIVVYHGTAHGGFQAFDRLKQDNDALYGPGFYFTENKEIADSYAESKDIPKAVLLKDEKTVATELRSRLQQLLKDQEGKIAKVYLENSPEWRKVASMANDYSDGILVDSLKYDAVSGGIKWFEKQGANLSDLVTTTSETKAVYLNIRKPFDADTQFIRLDELPEEWRSRIEISYRHNDSVPPESGKFLYNELAATLHSKRAAREVLLDLGYDGITHIGGQILGDKHHRVWIAFEPNQVKSIDNSGEFDLSKDSIYESRFASEHGTHDQKSHGNRDGVGANQTDTPEFKSWFGDSQVVDDQGEPLRLYHGTRKPEFDEFKPEENWLGLMFFADKPGPTERFSYDKHAWRDEDSRKPSRTLPVYVRAEKVFDGRNPEHVQQLVDQLGEDRVQAGRDYWTEFYRQRPEGGWADVRELPPDVDKIRKGGWQALENPEVIGAIRAAGFDGITMTEEDEDGNLFRSYAVFDPTQVKSASGNRGTWSRASRKITEAERWVTLQSGAHVMIDSEGVVTKGPAGIKGQDLDDTSSKAARRRRRIGRMGDPGEPASADRQIELKVARADAVQQIKERMKLDVPDAEIAKLTGAMHGSLVSVRPGPGGGLRLENEDDRYHALVLLHQEDGEKVLENQNFQVFDRGFGIGTELFFNQVDQAEKLGVSRITVDSVGSWEQRENHNGYYTWPRLGFDGDLPANWKERLADNGMNPEDLPDKLKDATRVSDFFRLKDGRHLWKLHGFGVHLEFDLQPGSRSRQVLDSYYKSGRRAKDLLKRDAEVSESVPARERFGGLSFDVGVDEHEAIFESAWRCVEHGTHNQKDHGNRDGASAAAPAPAKLTQTPAFQEWFGKSKVVDDSGAPLKVFHGTLMRFDDPNLFDPSKSELGVHFGTSDVADLFATPYGMPNDEPRMYPVYLAIENPLRLKDEGSWGWSSLRQRPDIFSSDEIHAAFKAGKKPQDLIQAKGFDGIEYYNRREVPGLTDDSLNNRIKGKEKLDWAETIKRTDAMTDEEFLEKVPEATKSYIVFRKDQIKSATGNKGTFKRGEGNINESSADWDESEHPRDEDGKFTEKGTGAAGGPQYSDAVSKARDLVLKFGTDPENPDGLIFDGEIRKQLGLEHDDEHVVRDAISSLAADGVLTWYPFVKLWGVDRARLDRERNVAGGSSSPPREPAKPIDYNVKYRRDQRVSGWYNTGLDTAEFSGTITGINPDTAGGQFSLATIELDEPMMLRGQPRTSLLMTLDQAGRLADDKYSPDRKEVYKSFVLSGPPTADSGDSGRSDTQPQAAAPLEKASETMEERRARRRVEAKEIVEKATVRGMAKKKPQEITREVYIARESLKKLKEMSVAIDTLWATHKEWERVSSLPRPTMQDYLALERMEQQPDVAKALKKYGPKKNETGYMMVWAAMDSLKGRTASLEENLAEGWWTSSDLGEEMGRKHEQAVRESLEAGEDVPDEVVEPYRYNDWIPQSYRDKQTTQHALKMFGEQKADASFVTLAKKTRESLSLALDTISAVAKLREQEPGREQQLELGRNLISVKNRIADLEQEMERIATEHPDLTKMPTEARDKFTAFDDERWKLYDRVKELESVQESARRYAFIDHLRERRQALGTPETSLKIDIASDLLLDNPDEVEKARQFLEWTLGPEYSGSTLILRRLPPDATYGQNRAYCSGGIMYVPSHVNARTIVHEFGHVLDHTKGLGEYSKGFLIDRTQAEPAERLVGNYKPDEVASRDGFMWHYTGKYYYGKESSEVLSMGLQHLFEDWQQFLAQDADHFRYTLAAASGEIKKMPQGANS